MSKQTIHIKSPINRDDLDAVITGLEVACGGIRIQVEDAFDLVVTDERQAAALEALFSGNDLTSEKVQEVKKPKIHQQRYLFRSQRKDLLYEFLTGERVNQQTTGGALYVMLKSGKLVPGTYLSHPTKGKLLVVRNELGIFSLQSVSSS